MTTTFSTRTATDAHTRTGKTPDVATGAHNPSQPTAAPQPRTATRPSSRRRVRPTFLAFIAAVIAAVAMIGGTGTASANTNTSMCLHGTRTYIWQTLPANPSGGTVLDLYLYHYTQSGWKYTGSAIRLRGTTGGYWLTSSGHMTQHAYFSVAPGSGYYVVRAHAFNTYASQWTWIYGYADDIRGGTTYCRS